MFKHIRPALAALILMTLITGVLHPLSVTAVAQLAFAEQANGSLVRDREGQVRGSTLLAQPFDGPECFNHVRLPPAMQPLPAALVIWLRATRCWSIRSVSASANGTARLNSPYRWSW